jgi:hypothetical protein
MGMAPDSALPELKVGFRWYLPPQHLLIQVIIVIRIIAINYY